MSLLVPFPLPLPLCPPPFQSQYSSLPSPSLSTFPSPPPSPSIHPFPPPPVSVLTPSLSPYSLTGQGGCPCQSQSQYSPLPPHRPSIHPQSQYSPPPPLLTASQHKVKSLHEQQLLHGADTIIQRHVELAKCDPSRELREHEPTVRIESEQHMERARAMLSEHHVAPPAAPPRTAPAQQAAPKFVALLSDIVANEGSAVKWADRFLWGTLNQRELKIK